MRILHISSARHYGGGERHFRDLVCGLTERGHEVFVALRPTNEWESRLEPIPRSRFLYVSIRNSFGMFSAKRIGRFLAEEKIDIVHAHLARDYIPASVAARVAKTARLALTRHVTFPLKPFHRLALNNVDAAIAVSPAVEKELLAIFQKRRVHTILNGLDVRPAENAAELGAEFRRDHSISPEAKLVLSVGELKPLKGQLDLVLAIGEVAKTDDTTHFVIVGVDNTAGNRFRRDLRRLAATLNIANRITWLDWVEDTRPMLAAADIFVSPSQSESFGLAILEAMASGKPVVATETEGARVLIDDAVLLSPVNDPVSLAARIRSLLADSSGAAKKGEHLRQRAAREFSLARFLDEHEALYDSLLDGTAATARK